MMDETRQSYLDSIKKKSAKVFDPDFFGPYSFEYAYRLFLVYAAMQKDKVREIRVSEAKAFDSLFLEDLKRAISFSASFQGVSLEPEQLNSLSQFANDYIVSFLKSSMKDSPIKLAQKVSESMNGQVKKTLKARSKPSTVSLFSEQQR